MTELERMRGACVPCRLSSPLPLSPTLHHALLVAISISAFLFLAFHHINIAEIDVKNDSRAKYWQRYRGELLVDTLCLSNKRTWNATGMGQG